MRRPVDLTIWALVGLAGLLLLLWAFPRTYPFYPQDWTVNKGEAEELALEHLRVLGEPVEDALVVSKLDTSMINELRMLDRRDELSVEAMRDSGVNLVMTWEVFVYPPGTRPNEWRYMAMLAPDGEVVALIHQIPETEELPDLSATEARRRADAFLVEQGFDLADYGEPEVRRSDLENRTDTVLRYAEPDPVLGPEVPYGVEVTFAGDVLTGFRPFVDDPDREELVASFQGVNLWNQVRVMAPFLLFPFVAAFFLRRYHAGEVGVRRAVQIFVLAFVAGTGMIVLAGAAASQGNNFGPLSRAQMVWAWGIQIVVFWISSMSVMAAVAWSVGEAQSRERWPDKLAAFDALFKGRFDTATVARSSLRGFAAGLAITGSLIFLVSRLLPGRYGAPALSTLFGPAWESAVWPGLALLGFSVAFCLYSELFARLFLLSTLVPRIGKWAAALVVVAASAVLFWTGVASPSGGGGLVVGAAVSAVLVALFLRYDLLTALIAAMTSMAASGATPLLLSDDAFLQLQGALPLFVLAMPLLLSLRHIASGEEFVYRYEDVPPHVRRIAERERQRVELETARRIQSSILPELPPQLNGVQLAHAYLPASEVGGDFYDVLALEDGRLAVAVGDVAGHGVSSGLVMSMAKSALAVQVAFNPDVPDVFRTLNRTVYQTARKRLLATLCYAIVDPAKMRLLYGSAGHLFPYRIGRDGRVEALESVSYPLGVRETVDMLPKEAKLAPGDTLFLFSDGIVEARGEGSDDMFGFERLEAALARHSHLPPNHLRDAVLEEVERFTGPVPREDDQTVVVLRLPE